jgi:hypothetical protein
MMPPVYLWGNEKIIQEPSFHVTATMRKDPRSERGSGSYNKRKRVEANNPKYKTKHDVSKSKIDRVRNQRVRGLQVRDPVMVRVKLPQKRD